MPGAGDVTIDQNPTVGSSSSMSWLDQSIPMYSDVHILNDFYDHLDSLVSCHFPSPPEKSVMPKVTGPTTPIHTPGRGGKTVRNPTSGVVCLDILEDTWYTTNNK